MAEGAGLLNQYAGNRIEGSNPSLSASFSPTSEKIRSRFRDTAQTPLFRAVSGPATRYPEPETGTGAQFGGLSAEYLCSPKIRFRFWAL